MIRKRYFIEIGVSVVRIEGGETAVPGLHAADPFGCTPYRFPVAFPVYVVHGPGDDCCIVEVGVVNVVELKGPSATLEVRMVQTPIPGLIEQLPVPEPVEAPQDGFRGRFTLLLAEGKAGEGRVPNGRYAGLALGRSIVDDNQLP